MFIEPRTLISSSLRRSGMLLLCESIRLLRSQSSLSPVLTINIWPLNAAARGFHHQAGHREQRTKHKVQSTGYLGFPSKAKLAQ